MKSWTQKSSNWSWIRKRRGNKIP